MELILTNKDYQRLFDIFKEISLIPRSSGNEKAISDYVVDFGKNLNLVVFQDDMWNVIIRRRGGVGFENAQAVILQGHLDMVCEKNGNTNHDFSTDGLKLCEENGWITANGTTLGADNGIAVALMLALLENEKLCCPPLECVFTVQEEIGLIGAQQLDVSKLTGKIMINLDSETAGVATTSCAGGMRVDLVKNAAFERLDNVSGKITTLEIGGLLGGHSGMDIDKERANSIKLMGRLLAAANENNSIRIVSLSGGNKDNAIPRECKCEFLIMDNAEKDVFDIIKSEFLLIKSEFIQTEKDIYFTISQRNSENVRAIDKQASNSLISLIYLAPNGVKTRNVNAGGFVVSSLNLGIVKVIDDTFRITFACRSSVKSLQQNMRRELKSLGDVFGYNTVVSSEYPGWEYNPNSKIRELFQKHYLAQSGKKLVCEAIHAGLECGLFCEKLTDLDTIAVGPQIENCHTPDERVEKQSCCELYQLLCNVLSDII